MAIYFVYKILPSPSNLVKNLELIEQFKQFKAAKNFVREQRTLQDIEDKSIYKIVFAENQLEAEERLQEIREKPILREWEK